MDERKNLKVDEELHAFLKFATLKGKHKKIEDYIISLIPQKEVDAWEELQQLEQNRKPNQDKMAKSEIESDDEWFPTTAKN